MKSPIKYYGAKAKLAPRMIPLLPPHRRYVEVCCGSAAMLFAKPPSAIEIINDRDAEVVNFFRMVRDRGSELRDRFELTLYARDEFDAAVDGYDSISDPMERARRFGVILLQSINGAGDAWSRDTRRNRSSSYFASVAAITAASARLRPVQIENRHFRDLIPACDGPDALFFIDPPYLHETRTAKSKYRWEMTDAEHRELLDLVRGIRGGVMLCGHPHPLYDAALADWDRYPFDASSDAIISATSGTPRPRRAEILWIKKVTKSRAA